MLTSNSKRPPTASLELGVRHQGAHLKTLLLLITFFTSLTVNAENLVKIHAPHYETFACVEHWEGQFNGRVRDARGTDCIIQEFTGEDDRYFIQPFTGKGHKNEDWFGYNKQVLAPCDCTVEKVHINPITNQPGIQTPGIASSITFEKSDGTKISYAHIKDVTVQVGDKVKAGDIVAKVGNNGWARNPHIHIAAWKDLIPMQIQFDQKTIELKDRGLMKK